MEHHSLDIAPVPSEKEPMYINEPWLIDPSLLESQLQKEPEEKTDNIRVYIPMDINGEAIMRRLNYIVSKYGEASEDNEFNFSQEVEGLISQIEIYDQVWYVRHAPADGKHSVEAVGLVKEFVEELERIPDACSECFPFETIDELKREYSGIK